ncbi:dTMP kinase [Marinactinospora thermotolerans]|uniref:Thymidylate kinase n=1 Tax=Marinactinospora thermotolerans DSM 45154 TaxID=1122192 RepID=A0A1T4SRU9_9ACTN|nr:dTMP kinase [Marinactinospora thermotolerans]SKA30907.1 thymidylate kinase [Marinactinospora thermotolerans DSM 45154]
MSRSGPFGEPGETRSVLAIKPFRRLWISLSLSSLGDWLSLLALMSLATILTQDRSPLVQYFAVSGVVLLKLLPSILLSPLAGALADRIDRRLTMVVGDILRGLLYISIPIVGRLDWLLIANFLAECVALFWAPAKDATVPNLVPKNKLEQANQLSLFSTYGSAPVAAGLFALLAAFSSVLGGLFPSLGTPEADLALYINGVTFFVAAVVIWRLPVPAREPATADRSSVLRTIWEGWRFAGTTPLVRGLLLGMLGAFAAGGAVVGVARLFVETLGAGNAGFGVMFGAVFAGMAVGMFAGPRILRDFSRRRLFGLGLGMSAVALLLVGLIPNMVFAAGMTVLVGAGAGVAWVTGLTMLGREVEDDIRGRTFAFLHAAAKIVLMGSVAVAPLLAGLIGSHRWQVRELTYDFSGSAGVLLIAALLLLLVAFVSYRQMNDSPEVSLLTELVAAVRGVPLSRPQEAAGVRGTFIVLEGGEGAGKSTQARQLAIWLREEGFDVVTTREPGATKLGMRLRALLLDKEHTGMSARAEALLYAADRAEHVSSVIRPALERGAIVVSDRYVDSTLAYQGAGRELATSDVARINEWATGGLVPDLTILLDLPVGLGMARHGRPADRLEAEPEEFHERVRAGFRALAERAPERYLVLDAQRPQEEITREIRRRIRPILPDPVPGDAEEITGMLPIIKD